MSVLIAVITLLLPVFAAETTLAEEQTANVGADAVGKSLQDSMIWTPLPADEAGRKMCVAFRKQFTVPEEPAKAELHVFADARYLLWINGRYVVRGPSRFHPRRPEYDTVDVKPWLRRGSNTLAVLVQTGLSGRRIMRHAPGLGVRLDVENGGGAGGIRNGEHLAVRRIDAVSRHDGGE